MKRCVKYFVGILLILSILADIKSALALTYSQDIGVSFTFNPVIGLTLSASDLIIPSLAPGTAADSNIIDVNVITNSTNGYTLNASVGNNTTYDTRNLVHVNNTVTNTFSSVDFGSSITSNTSLSDNTWAYSYSIDSGTTWTGYNGLPLYSDTTNIAQLKNSTTPVSSASGDAIKFKIAAKASTTQASGEYRNVINFQLTATPLPTTLYMAYENAGKEKHNGYFKLQDMNADICNAAEVLDEGSQMQAIDTRDNKVYWITKLRDGKCWMTQNLDHDIDKDFAYTPENTDIPANWTPDKSTYSTGTIIWDIGATGYYIQQSYDPGAKYWNEIFEEEIGYDQAACERYNGHWDTDENYCYDPILSASTGNLHYHLGNYYNWGAAVAMNDTSAYATEHQDVDQSICPAGWTLPKNGDNIGSFRYLVEQYGWSNGFMYNPLIWNTPLYFPLSGCWYGHQYGDGVGSAGFWQSPVVHSDAAAYSTVASQYEYVDFTINNRNIGQSVRCVSR